MITNTIIVPLFIHMACAIICMGASATFHLLKEHSHKMHKSLAKVDYAGISIMIAGSSTPPFYYSFFCEEMQCKWQVNVTNNFRLEKLVHWAYVLLLLYDPPPFYDPRFAKTPIPTP